MFARNGRQGAPELTVSISRASALKVPLSYKGSWVWNPAGYLRLALLLFLPKKSFKTGESESLSSTSAAPGSATAACQWSSAGGRSFRTDQSILQCLVNSVNLGCGSSFCFNVQIWVAVHFYTLVFPDFKTLYFLVISRRK